MALFLLTLGSTPLSSENAFIGVGPGGFRPAMHVMPAGSTVTWVEKSGQQHELIDDQGLLKASVLYPQQRVVMAFPQELVGDYVYRCRIHGQEGFIGFVRQVDSATPSTAPSNGPTGADTADQSDLWSRWIRFLGSLFGTDEPSKSEPEERIPDPNLEAARRRVADLESWLATATAPESLEMIRQELDQAREELRRLDRRNRLESELRSLERERVELSGKTDEASRQRRHTIESRIRGLRNDLARPSQQEPNFELEDPELYVAKEELGNLTAALELTDDPDVRDALLVDIKLLRLEIKMREVELQAERNRFERDLRENSP